MPHRAATAVLVLAAIVAWIGPAAARNWGSIDFKLAEEGTLASARIDALVGATSTYQRLRNGEVVGEEETFAVVEDTYDGSEAYRIDARRCEAGVGEALLCADYAVFLDRATLRPLVSRRRADSDREWVETVYGRNEAEISGGGAGTRTISTRSNTVEFPELQLLFLKFFDDSGRVQVSFIKDEQLFHFGAHLKGVETVILESGTYEAQHVVCNMRGTWAYFAPKLHFWIEAESPHRLIKYQVRREVLELVE